MTRIEHIPSRTLRMLLVHIPVWGVLELAASRGWLQESEMIVTSPTGQLRFRLDPEYREKIQRQEYSKPRKNPA